MGCIKKTLKSVAKWGFISYTAITIGYAATYTGLSTYAIYDYKTNNIERIKKAKNSLVIKKYDVTIEDKVKHITIIGETHIYNHKESEFAKEFIDDYEYVAMEGNGGQGEFDGYMLTMGLCYLPFMTFYSMGNGRFITNPTMHYYALEKEKTLFYLEAGEDEFKKKTTDNQRRALLDIGALALITAPFAYFDGKNELTHGERDYTTEDIPGYLEYAVNASERDSIMVKNILKILEKEEVDSLLCVMGKAHVPGVEKKLKAKIKELEEKVEINTE